MRIVCIKCGVLKDSDLFSKDKYRKSGKHPYCKDCVKSWRKTYDPYHRAEAAQRTRDWSITNKDRIAQYRARLDVKEHKKKYMLEYRKKNKIRKREISNAYEKVRQRNDINYKLAVSLRKRLCAAIKQGNKAGSAVIDLGCSIPYFKKYLEAKFLPGMTWDNWGITGWHIDHIRPLSKFNLTDRDQFMVAANYKNMQPLWYGDNIAKSNKT